MNPIRFLTRIVGDPIESEPLRIRALELLMEVKNEYNSTGAAATKAGESYDLQATGDRDRVQTERPTEVHVTLDWTDRLGKKHCNFIDGATDLHLRFRSGLL